MKKTEAELLSEQWDAEHMELDPEVIEQMVLYEVDPDRHLATITFNNPDRMNALPLAALERVGDLTREAEVDDRVKVILYKGNGPCFGTGADARELGHYIGYKKGDSKETRKRPPQHSRMLPDRNLLMRSFQRPIDECLKATICQVHSYCYGGHLQIAMAADIVIATPDAKFTHPAIRYLGAGPQDLWNWIENLGMKKMKDAPRRPRAGERRRPRRRDRPRPLRHAAPARPAGARAQGAGRDDPVPRPTGGSPRVRAACMPYRGQSHAQRRDDSARRRPEDGPQVSEPVSILGATGNLGFGLAVRLAKAGVPVIIGSRDAGRAAEAADRAREKVPDGSFEGRANADAAGAAEIVFVTVPFASQAQTLAGLKDTLREGQLVVDATVPLAPAIGGKPTRVIGVWQGSAAQQAQEIVPAGVTVVSALHTVSAEKLTDLDHALDEDVLVCGRRRDDKRRVAQVIDRIDGLRCVDAGPLEMSRIVETFTAMLIGINGRYKTDAGIRITNLPDGDLFPPLQKKGA